MRKKVVKNPLSKQSKDKVWIRNVLKLLFEHGAVTLILGKAKRLKSVVDSLLSRARTESLMSIRQNEKQVGDYGLAKKIAAVAKGSKRNSGFVSIKKVDVRRGDGATRAKIELLDFVKPEKKITPVIKNKNA